MSLENQTSNLGNCSQKLESPFFEKIVAYYRDIEINATSYEFYLDLGQTFYRLGTELNQENFYSYQEIWELLAKAKQANTNDSLTELYDLSDSAFLLATSHLSDEDFSEELYRTYLKRSIDVEGKNCIFNALGHGVFTRQQCSDLIRQSSEFISLLVDSIASRCFQEAIAAYRRAVELNPDYDKSYRYLGEALASQGKLDEAILAYRRAIEFNPNFHELHNSLGETFYRLAMALNPESFSSYSRLGEIFFHKGKDNNYFNELYRFNDHFFLQATSQLNDEQFIEEVYRTYLKREPDEGGKNYFLHYICNGSFTRHQSLVNIRKSSEFTPFYIIPIISFCLEEAIGYYRAAIALNSSFNIYFHNLEKALDRQAELDIKSDSLQIYHLIAGQFYYYGRYDWTVKLQVRSAEVQNELAKTYQFDKLGIRFLTQEWIANIGHLGLLDYYMKMKMLGWLPPHQTILFAAPYQSANPCYLNYWYSYFPVVIPPAQLQLLSPLTKYLEDRISMITLSSGETLPLYEAVMKVQKQWEAEKRSHLHTLSDSDEDRGWSCLHELGVSKDAWFVSLHVRDTGYVNGQWIGSSSGRNAHIESYLLAVQSIVERGGWVIRMGDRQMKHLPPMPQVIDYAHSDAKSDWMDVFLWAKCRFFIGTPSGPSVVPPTFGVPCVLTNWASIQFRQHFSQDLFIPKLYWSESDLRYLTFKEMLSPAYIVTENVDYFDSIGVKVVDNTPEDIDDLVWEMLERLEGKINYTEEDDLLQSRFAQLVDPDNIYSGSRMGRNFLQKYAYLINLHPDNFDFYLQLGNTLVSQNQWKEALVNYRRAAELNPDSFECHHQLGKIFYSLASDLNYESVQSYNWLVELLAQPSQSNDFSTDLLHLSDSAFLLATSHLSDEDFSEELYRTYLKRAIDVEGKNCIFNGLGHGVLTRLQCPDLIRQSSEFISLLVDSIASRCFQEAIAAYRRVVELNPDSDELCRCLGEAFAQKGNWEEAITCFRKAIELHPSSVDFYQSLGETLSQVGQKSDTADVYMSATSHYMIAALLAKQGMLDEAISYFQKSPQIKLSEEAIYENIWNGMNQILPTLNDNFPDYLTEVNQQSAYQYFDQNSQYKEITISSLSENDKIFLVNSGLSLANLELIFNDDIFLEEIYINSFIPQSKHELSKKVEGKVPHIWQGLKNQACQKSIVETGYIYSVCPTTSKVIISQQSFHSVSWLQMLFYRFVGCEVFYLLIGHHIGCKIGIYFPRLNLIIYQLKDPNIIPEINRFKSYAVSYWQEFKRYISSNTPKELVAAQGFYPNLGHYLWNDVTGIQYLYDNGILNKISKLLMGPHEYLKIADIFAEIPPEKIVQIPDNLSVFKTILEKNYFAVRATGYVITQGLATRIYEAYHKKCSKTFLEEVERSKKHFPLLCFQIRTHNRVWLSQVEGIANIITSLYPDFPNIGVVFEGFSRPEREELNNDVKKTDYTWDLEKMIESENAVVDQIRTLIPPDICIYSAIGSMIYETIVWDHAMDMFIAPGGSGLTFISWIANKPGVIHGNREACVSNAQRYWIESRENIVPPVFISLEYVVDDEASTSHPPNRNYNCDWKVVYQEALKILKQLQERG